MAERAGLDFDIDDGEDVDISALVKPKKDKAERPANEKEVITKTAEESGFSSRQPKKTRRRGKRSPYTQQKNVKMRPGMPELFIDVCEKLGLKDYELMEHAIEAVLQKHKLKDEQESFKELVKSK